MTTDSFRFLLGDLAVHLGEPAGALWNGQTVPGRFYVDPVEVGLGDIEPGLGTTTSKFYCDRARVPQPWPTIGDHLFIRGQDYEIVERDEDDLGEFAFRMIKLEIGLSTVTSEGAYYPEPQGPGRPTRRAEIVAAYESAVAAGLVSRAQPLHEVVSIVRPRVGNGLGLSDRTLRKILGTLVRERHSA
jgi:hypothetical protein